MILKPSGGNQLVEIALSAHKDWPEFKALSSFVHWAFFLINVQITILSINRININKYS